MAIPSVEADEQTWSRVGKVVSARRLWLGLTVAEAAAKAGPGIELTTWSKLENAQQTSFSVRGLLAVCRALGWTPDSVERILQGLDPVIETGEPTDTDRIIDLTDKVSDLEEQVAEVKRLLDSLLPLLKGR